MYTLIGSAVFAQLKPGSPYTLQWAAPFPLKIALSHGDVDTHMVPGFTRVHNLNGISIGSAVLAGLSQHIGWEERLQNDIFCVGGKHLINMKCGAV